MPETISASEYQERSRKKRPQNTPGGEWKNCEICNTPYYVAPARLLRGKYKFCSRKCRGVWIANEYLIKNNGYIGKAKRKKIEVRVKIAKLKVERAPKNNCKYCGKKCRMIYCNMTCYTERKHMEKGNKIITKPCLNCGKMISVTPGQVNAGFGKYCSWSCSSQFRIKSKKETIYGNSKGGKREDLNNVYFRSRWEANFARYLNFLIKQNQVVKWEYEPDTFYFDGIKRGTVSYTPDFKIWYSNDSSPKYVEIKGYLNDVSKIKLKRMGKYYPNIAIRLIQGKEYRELSKKMKALIPGWEIDQKKRSMF